MLKVLLGEVSKELVTLEIVMVRLVLALTIELRVIFTEVLLVTKHDETIPVLVNKQVELAVDNCIYDGNVIII